MVFLVCVFPSFFCIVLVLFGCVVFGRFFFFGDFVCVCVFFVVVGCAEVENRVVLPVGVTPSQPLVFLALSFCRVYLAHVLDGAGRNWLLRLRTSRSCSRGVLEVASIHEDVRWLLPQTHERIYTHGFHLAAIVATHARRGTAMQAGRILVDGVPLTDLNLRNLHRKTAIVAQDTQLFATRYLSTSGRVFAFARQGGASFSYRGVKPARTVCLHTARVPRAPAARFRRLHSDDSLRFRS